MKAAVLFSTRALLISALIFYSNTLWLLPRYLFTAKYIKYFLMVALLTSSAATLYQITEKYIISEKQYETFKKERTPDRAEFESGKGPRDRAPGDASEFGPDPGLEEASRENHINDHRPMGPPPLLVFMSHKIPLPILHGILSSLGMIFISTLFAYIIRDRELQQKRLDLTNQNLEFEMKFLKSQIKPPFLIQCAEQRLCPFGYQSRKHTRNDSETVGDAAIHAL